MSPTGREKRRMKKARRRERKRIGKEKSKNDKTMMETIKKDRMFHDLVEVLLLSDIPIQMIHCQSHRDTLAHQN